MNGNSENKNKSYKIYLIAFFVILALPLIAAPPWFHPAAWGKAIVFRIIISILVFFLIWQIISKKTKINFKDLLDRKNKVFWPFWLLIALWGIFLLATIFSLDPYYSFWESPYRAGGFLNFSCYIIFAVLAFLIIKERSWQKIWDFTLAIGVLASIMAILQYFEVFSKYLIPYTGRPPASFGNSIFLAIYLLFLIFLALCFGLKEKRYLKKILYFSIILLFISVVLITRTRAVYLGLIIGFLYFFLLYPVRGYQKKEEPQNKQTSNGVYPIKSRSKKILFLKIITVIALFSVICSIYFVNTQEQLPEFIQNNRTLKAITSRLSFKLIFEETRFPVWRVTLKAIKEKPILGWGPENFSIAFDKHYDPVFPNLPRTWWDRTHNFMLEIAVTAGIPALIIYLSLFVVLFWQLQKVKRKNPNDALICHGIQAAFIGYLTANFFSFDSFSTYLISFLLIAYSLFLIRKSAEDGPQTIIRDRVSVNSLWKSGLIFGLFCILILFIWFSALKPLSINKKTNWAIYYSEKGNCEQAVEKMDSILSSHSIADTYVRLQYLDIIRNCLKQDVQRKYVLAPKAVSILRELTKLRPKYTRTWFFLGNYLNILIENSQAFKIENVEDLKKEANACYQKAYELAPKRDQIFHGWIQTDFFSENYEGAKLKAEQCINLDPNSIYCWWQKGLVNIYLKEFEQADKNIEIAIKKGHNANSKNSLIQLHKAHVKALETIEDKDKNKELYIECYKRLADIYEDLIWYVDRGDPQYYAPLAHSYKILGEYEKARESALAVATFLPEALPDVEEFLKSILMLDHDYSNYYFYLARIYYRLEELKQAKEYALFAMQYSTPGTKRDKEIKEFVEMLKLNKSGLW